MKKIQIIPAVLPKSLEELEEKLELLKEAYHFLEIEGKLMVQIDICSEELFENFDFSVIENYIDIFDFELDLMNINIDKINQRLNNPPAGGELSNFERIIFHIEDWGKNSLGVVPPFGGPTPKEFSFDLGLALIPKTPIEEIRPYLDKINFVQFMGIDEVGYQGSAFNPEVIEKIKNFRAQNPEMIISVDGGVDLENAQSLVDAGANRLVSGSAIFGGNNTVEEISENIKNFRRLCEERSSPEK